MRKSPQIDEHSIRYWIRDLKLIQRLTGTHVTSKTCLSLNRKNRDRKMRPMRRQQLKDKRKRHSLKYAANWPERNKMKVGKWVHGLSNSVFCF